MCINKSTLAGPPLIVVVSELFACVFIVRGCIVNWRVKQRDQTFSKIRIEKSH